MSQEPSTYPAIVLGGSGYVAGEFLRLIAAHPQLTLGGVVSTSQAGEPVAKTFAHLAPAYPHELFVSIDGVIAKPVGLAYQPGKRAMIKVKHARTAECVVAGFRWHKSGKDAVGSLLLGLYDDAGTLQHVGVTSSFTMAMRRQLAKELAPLRKNAMQDHPWRDWAGAAAESSRMPGAQSRWSAGKDLSWEPLRIERVCEIKYDHMQGDRFRHAAVFQRWRPDKQPGDCRYDQLEVTTAYELEKVFGASRRER